MTVSRNPGKNWRLRQRVKYWFGNHFPSTRGKVRYFSTEVYFPPGHELFFRLCAQGVYEADLLNAIRKHLPVDGLLFDVGANIGLTAIPVLESMGRSKVVSFEPSPNSLPYLKKTNEGSSFGDRWKVIEKAVGEAVGNVDFQVNSETDGAFDSRGATGRKELAGTVTVPMTTIDQVWSEMDSPDVSVIKIDVEGFEKEVLAGAGLCLEASRPVIILEWSRANLDGLNRDPLELISLASTIGYEVITMETGQHVANETILDFELLSSENFVLFPMRK